MARLRHTRKMKMLSNAQCVQGHDTFPHPPIDGEYTRCLAVLCTYFVRIRLPPLPVAACLLAPRLGCERLDGGTAAGFPHFHRRLPSHFATFGLFGFAAVRCREFDYDRCQRQPHTIVMEYWARTCAHIGFMPMHYILVCVHTYVRCPHRSRSLTCTGICWIILGVWLTERVSRSWP